MTAGEPVSYDFLIENPSDEPIAIRADEDIRLNCGCSSLVPESRRIVGCSRTHVKATVKTQGKRGPFAHGGTVVWTGTSGVKRTINLQLRGEAIPAIEWEPEVVRFDTSEVRERVVKDVVLKANVPVDWSSLTWSNSTPHIEILDSRIDGGEMRCKVRCSLPEGQEALQETLSGYVTLSAVPSSSTKTTSFAVPILAEQVVDLVVTPKTVPVAFRGKDGKGTARLLFHGELLGRGESLIRSIRCEGFQVLGR